MDPREQALRELPSIDAALKCEPAQQLLRELRQDFVTACVRDLIDGWRREVLAGRLDAAGVRARKEALAAELERCVQEGLAPTLVPVVNATGVVVHTNLGRAPWPRRVAERALAVATGYANLEYDLERGQRGSRESHVAAAARLFRAEAALIVN